MVLLAVPVRPIYVNDCSECEIVHGSEWSWESGRRPEQNPGCGDSCQQRLPLPPTLPGLGGCSRRRSRCSCDHLTQPTNCSVPVHLHNLGMLSHAGPEFYDVPVLAAYTGRPSAA